MGTCILNAEHCAITEKGVLQIVKIEQLKELVLGNPSDYLDEPAAKTEAAYKAIFLSINDLEELEMFEATLPSLSVGKQFVTCRLI